MSPYTRRSLLASAGLGALALSSGAFVLTGAGKRPAYTQYTYAQTDEIDADAYVTVAWQEQYNGTVLETQAGASAADVNATLDPDLAPYYVPDATGPVISLPNVLPGDTGRLAVGINVETIPPGEDALEVWFRLVVTENAENGVVEPEAATGDDATTGELAAALDVTVWEDVGVAGIGGCDGRLTELATPDEPVRFEPVVADGSLLDAETALTAGVQLGQDCLVQGDTRCLGLTWELPWESGNELQGDSVAFDLSFAAVSCNTGNPFDSATSGGDQS